MPTAAKIGRPRTKKYPKPKKDFMRDMVIGLMKATDATPKDIAKATGLSKNTVYSFVNGLSEMRSGKVTAVVAYLQKRKGREIVVRRGSPSADN